MRRGVFLFGLGWKQFRPRRFGTVSLFSDSRIRRFLRYSAFCKEKGLMSRLHRNNAAEWMMVIVLTPFAWIANKFLRSSSPKPVTKLKNPPRSKVMIEGLPPRTMN